MVLQPAASLVGRAFRRLVRSGARLLPYPYCHGWQFARRYREVMATQSWDSDRIRGYQYRRLEQVLQHAYDQVPYYQQAFDRQGVLPGDLRSLEDLARFPTLAKDSLRTHYAELRAKDALRYRPFLHQTSGSTGTSVEFLLTREVDQYENAFVERQSRWAHTRPRDRGVTVRGAVLTEDGSEVAPCRRNGHELILSSFHLSDRSLPRYAELMLGFRPAVFRMYPSALGIITQYFRHRGLRRIPTLKAIITSSETLPAETRQEAEQFWRCRVYDWYGNGERCGAIGQCEYGTYHILEDYGFIELLPSQSPGLYRLVATTFFNRAMPLIRYDTRDLVSVSSEDEKPCPCGRSFRRVTAIDGRIESLVVTRDGRRVGRLDAAFRYSPGIQLAQIIQRPGGELCVRIVRGPAFAAADLERLTRELRLRLGEQIALQYEFVNDLPRTAAGKLRFVISEYSQPAS